MRYRIVSYCPDTHIEYDGRTPYEIGVGGGITARVRMAKALRQLGHDVRMVVNCPRHEVIDGVEYIPLEQFRKTDADVLIMNTSGGDLDLSPAKDLDVKAAAKIVWIHGTIEPKGLDSLEYGYTYAVSNFVAEFARREWSAKPKQLFVTHNAFEEQLFTDAERSKPVRDPYRIVYFSHPSKGLETAIEIVRHLRDLDPAFHLDVYGGNGLWGGKERLPVTGEGIAYHGLRGQRELTAALLASSFSIQLQGGIDSCPLSAFEALRAGCIILASGVGGYPELIKSGINGFLLKGDHRSLELRRQAAELISELAINPQATAELRRKAMAVPWDTRRAALTWLRHWDLVLEQGSVTTGEEVMECRRCGGESVIFPDGDRCCRCDFFSPMELSAAPEIPILIQNHAKANRRH